MIKRRYHFLFLFVGIFILANCTTPVKPKTDLEINNLKGDVILTVDDYESIFYNKDGFITQRLHELNKNMPILITYHYANGRLSFIESVAKDFHSKTNYYYTEKGILEKTIENSVITNTKINNVNFYRFDELGNKILDSTIYKFKSGAVPSYTRYYFTENQLDSSVLTFIGGNTTYYKDGNEIKTQVYDNKNGLKVLTNLFNYKYVNDSNGNWIQKKTFMNGQLVDSTNRKIFYKSQDIRSIENRIKNFKVN